ncbi:alpha/beta fold hydrolase [Fodinibius halophilus]|uniref:Alpha/beta hydrolase n=1 Tax=Fodinibius halophilus TaxID=1736908 RepID=A0A6M1T4U3_9BACT|nr:alpha/beta hydrolase [Fodinibius halophilus]NGP86981.1 alpha/beta hydrolase [Fodinibius halophilus]
MADCQFIALHGWGFDRHIWDHWETELSKYGNFQTYDRGYFDNPQEIKVDNSGGPVVLISHSFGLHWITKNLLEAADLLIITGGFLYFHPYAAQYKRRSRLIVQEMVNELEINPEKVLQRFYDNCFSPLEAEEIAYEELNLQLLLEDLQRLQDSRLDAEILKKVGKVCILHGSQDQIVPYKKGRQIYNQLQQYAQYFELKNAGHALPKTHHRQCLEFVTPEIQQVIKEKV